MNNVFLVSDTAGPLLTSMITMSKCLSLYLNREIMYNLINNLTKFVQTLNHSDQLVIKSADRVNTVVSMCYASAVFITGYLLILTPIFNYIYSKFMELDYLISTPVNTDFFIDIYAYPILFKCVYIWFTIAINIVMLNAIAVDTLFLGLSLNLCACFKIIQQRFESLNFNQTNHSAQYIFMQLVQEHANLLKLCEHLKEIYQPIILIQFLISSVNLCVIGFQILLSFGSISVLTHITFATAVFIQLLIYSYGGTQIMCETFKVSTSVYCSNWYLAPVRLQNDIFFCILRSQNATKLRGGFYEASLPAFISILSTTVSYITLLRTIAQW